MRGESPIRKASELLKAPDISLESLGLSSFVALDVETTGLDPTKDDLIEVGLCRFVGGEPTESYTSLVQYRGDLDPFIVQLTGLTTAETRDAPAFDRIARDLAEFAGNDPLVGHHVDFDLGFLRAAFSVLPEGKQAYGVWTSNPRLLDTSLLARVFWPELASFSLSALADTFQVSVVTSHRALPDAETTGRVLCSMISKLEDRVWSALASQLHRVVSTTKSGCNFFFSALASCAKNRGIVAETRSSVERSTDSRIPFAESMEMLLGEGGVFEERLPFFRHRPEQLQMAKEVATAFEQSSYLVIEAPTGVGKSLAYLTPALRWISDTPDENRQVVVSSYTKVLQHQLMKKDFPDQIKALARPFVGAVLKGRNNYLCKRRLNHVLTEGLEELSEGDRISLLPLIRWAMLTNTGDISEIHGFDPRTHPYLWAQVSSDSVACSGSRCSAAKGDFYRLAQDVASQADVVFVNHALLASDLQRISALGRSERRYVIDEAHHLEQAIIGAGTIELSAAILRLALSRLADEKTHRGLLLRVCKHLLSVGSDYALAEETKLTELIRSLFTAIRQHFATLNDRLIRQLPGNERSAKCRFRRGDILHKIVLDVLDPVVERCGELEDLLHDVLRYALELRGEDKLPADTLFEFRSASEEFSSVVDSLRNVLRHEDEKQVLWIEFSRSGNKWCALYSAPISVRRSMAEGFWPALNSAVLTSATLSANGSFDLLLRGLGLDLFDRHAVNTVSVRSPFDVSQQMMLLVPTYLPDPRSDSAAHSAAVIGLSVQIASIVPRGTLILCTSNDLVERITAALKPVAESQKRQLLSQWSSLSLGELVREFRERQDAILIGAASLWEGIDVVGEALQVLLITRIPFDVPTDPWFEARCEAIEAIGGNPFGDYSVPAATLRLKQGLGRLIRHQNDRGVAIVADPRLFTARYGGLIRGGLPSPAQPVNHESALFASIEEFFARS